MSKLNDKVELQGNGCKYTEILLNLKDVHQQQKKIMYLSYYTLKWAKKKFLRPAHLHALKQMIYGSHVLWSILYHV